MSPSATPATPKVFYRWTSRRATPATQNAGRIGGCHAPRLPRRVPRRNERLTVPERAAGASPVAQAPRLPRKTKVNVAKDHAFHVKRRWMSPSARPATQSAAASRAINGAQARRQSQPSGTSATLATQNQGGWCVTKLCMKDGV